MRDMALSNGWVVVLHLPIGRFAAFPGSVWLLGYDWFVITIT
jgi:hypothetical protein